MGYIAETINVDFVIPAENIDAAYEATAALDPSAPASTLEEVFQNAGVECEIDDDGALVVHFYCDKYRDSLERLFAAAGAFANEGWSVTFIGEEGEQWRLDASGVTDFAQVAIPEVQEAEARIAEVEAANENLVRQVEALSEFIKNHAVTADEEALREVAQHLSGENPTTIGAFGTEKRGDIAFAFSEGALDGLSSRIMY